MNEFTSTSLLGSAIVIVLVVVVVRRRRPMRVWTVNVLQVLTGIPSNPSLKPLELLYPGRKTPPDPEPNIAMYASENPHRESELPAGIRRNTTDATG